MPTGVSTTKFMRVLVKVVLASAGLALLVRCQQDGTVVDESNFTVSQVVETETVGHLKLTVVNYVELPVTEPFEAQQLLVEEAEEQPEPAIEEEKVSIVEPQDSSSTTEDSSSTTVDTAVTADITPEPAVPIIPMQEIVQPKRLLFRFKITEGTAFEQLEAFCRQFLQDLLELDEREEAAVLNKSDVDSQEFVKVSEDRKRSGNAVALYPNRVTLVMAENDVQLRKVLSVLKKLGRLSLNRAVLEKLPTLKGRQNIAKRYVSTEHVSVCAAFDALQDFFGYGTFTEEYRRFVKRVYMNGLMKTQVVLPLLERLGFMDDLEMLNAVSARLLKSKRCPGLSQSLLNALPRSVAAVLSENERARAIFSFHFIGSINFDEPMNRRVSVKAVEGESIEIVSDYDTIKVTVGANMSKKKALECVMNLKIVEFTDSVRRSSSN